MYLMPKPNCSALSDNYANHNTMQTTNRNKTTILMKGTVLLLSTMLLLASCGGGEQGTDKAAQLDKLKKDRAALDADIKKLEAEVNKGKPAKATPVTITEVATGNFNTFIEVQAAIQGDENIMATPQAPGVVTKVMVKTGQRVSKGQILATLDAGAVEQQIKAQDAQIALLKQLYEKQQKLWAQNIGTEVQLLSAKTNYDAAMSQRAALAEQRGMYQIKAPISGVVDEVNVFVGSMASPGQTGIRVVNNAELKAIAGLGESNLGQVKAGDPVKLVLNNRDTINTKLSYVSRSINPLSRTFDVEVSLGNNQKVSPNMSCRMMIQSYAAASTITIPVSVVQKTNRGTMVFVAEGNKAKEVAVTMGRIYNGMVEIQSGLNAGDKVITEGYQDLDNGELIAIQ